MLRVCLVEDESAVRETLRDTVPWGQCGCVFSGEAADGEMALPLIRQTKPDILITDIRMPFMDGLSLSRLVLRELPQTKIILISSHDDFELARQAIEIGVEQYLLKPITKEKLLEALELVREKIEGERARREYLTQSRLKAQEYEQFARRRFFERVAAGQLTVQQIYEAAARLDLDLRAQCYTIAFFSVSPEGPDAETVYSGPGARIRDALLEHFLKYPEYLLLRWDLTTYVVLIKGDTDKIQDYIRRCVGAVQGQYEAHAPELNWYVAVGAPTQRLSALSSCFEETSRLWACRYILPRQHILTAETVGFLTGTGRSGSLARLDAAKVSPARILDVLQRAGAEEIPGFADEYIRGVSEALEFKPFCQYLMLSVRFTAAEFAARLGRTQREFLASLDCLDMVGQNVTTSDLKQYVTEILLQAVKLRDSASDSQHRGLLKQAVDYVDSHFTEEDLSLQRVAKEINVSANYLSTVFRRGMGATFTEYVTEKRMELARELLRTTNKRSGEVAFSVGYRDPHYFSFLFKKTQGCTPRDYRAGGGR